MIHLDAITIILDEASQLALTIASHDVKDPMNCCEVLEELPYGNLGYQSNGSKAAPIIYDPEAPRRGRQCITLKEVRRYIYAVHHVGKVSDRSAVFHEVASSLSEGNAADWNQRLMGESLTGDFRVINYIGVAWIEVKHSRRIRFEIIPEKIGYEDDYRSMVEAIAGKCQQLLLDWNAPTSLSFSADPATRKRLLLEQFLFLRHCMGTDRLDLYLEILTRNPHRALIREDRWGAESDSRFGDDPIRHARDWAASNSTAASYFRGYLPKEINTVTKRETLDTAPNRFVKYALGQFREICQMVLDHPDVEGAAHDEAHAMRESLDSFLAQKWLWDVGDISQIPLNNQTLLKREGYRQVLEAWFLSDVAAQLDWEGREDAYDGNNRDVATLYEYWLYFELYELLSTEVGCEPVETIQDPLEAEVLPFMVQIDGSGLRINLKQGKASYSSFRYTPNEGMANRLHLYYNRSFQKQTILRSGTYSRPLRPDYTLVVIPESIAQQHTSHLTAEKVAEEQGQITYLHFDAKYRVESLTEIFGRNDSDEDEETRREEKSTKTYKRGDLYKMHTYNEAIRRTVGSYVLYPGTDSEKEHRFDKYHEILPGVGAFVMRPSQGDDGPDCTGKDALGDFIIDVVRHQSDRMSQLYRMRQNDHRVVKDAPAKVTIDGNSLTVPNQNTQVILGYMKDEDSIVFRKKGAFYCRATDSRGKPARLDLAISVGTLLIGYKGGYQNRISTDWCAEVSRCEIVTGNQLKERAGFKPSEESSHYLLFQLEEPWTIPVRDLTGIAPSAGGLAVQTTWLTIASAPKI